MSIWISQGENNVHGPYTLDQVKDMVTRGELFPDKDWAQLDEAGKWIPLQNVPGLALSTKSPLTRSSMPQQKTNSWSASLIMLGGGVVGAVICLVAILLFGPDSDEAPQKSVAATNDGARKHRPETNQKTEGGEDKNPGGEQVPGNKELTAFMAKAEELDGKIDSAATDEKALEALKPGMQELMKEAGEITGANGRAANARADELAGKLADQLGRLPIEVTLEVTIAPPEAETAGCKVSEGEFGVFDFSKPRKSGDEIELNAVPGEGWKFAGWSHGENRQSSILKHTLPREKSLPITARFEQDIGNLLTLKNFKPGGNNFIVFADGFDKPIKFASQNSPPFPLCKRAAFSWRDIGSNLAFKAEKNSYKPASGSTSANLRLEHGGRGFTIDVSRRTLDLGDLKPQAGEAFIVDFSSSFDAGFSLVVFDLNSLRENDQIVQLESMVLGLAASKSAGFDKECALHPEGVHARGGKWISGSYDRVKLKQQLSVFHGIVGTQPGAMAIIENRLNVQARADFAYLKGLAGKVKAQTTLGSIRYFDKGRADYLLTLMTAIIGIHSKENPQANDLNDRVSKLENRLGVPNGKGKSYPRILAAINNYLVQKGINTPAFFKSSQSLSGMDASNLTKTALEHINKMQTTSITPKKQALIRKYLAEMKNEIKKFDVSYAKTSPLRLKSVNIDMTSQDRVRVLKDNALAAETWGAAKASSFKKIFEDVPYDARKRQQYFASIPARYLQTYRSKLKENLQAFDGFDWATVPIGASETWSIETASDMQKALEALKESLNMAAVQNLAGEKTAPETWTYEASGHLCLRLK